MRLNLPYFQQKRELMRWHASGHVIWNQIAFAAHNPKVGGSNPPPATKNFPSIQALAATGLQVSFVESRR
jgi:hypothetical protein